MRPLLLLNVALCLCCSGCSRATLVKRIVPQQDEVFAREYVELLRHRAFDQIEPKLDPSISTFGVRNTLDTMADMFPAEEPKSTKSCCLQSPSFPHARIRVPGQMASR